MAGKPTTRENLERARAELDAANAEVARLKKLLALHAPHAVNGDMPEPVTEYSPDICERVLAMGAMGMAEDEWIATLGLSETEWTRMKDQHVELTEASAKAFARFKAFWSNAAREAIEKNNTRFPMGVYQTMMNVSLKSGGGSKGNATELVILDLRAKG